MNTDTASFCLTVQKLFSSDGITFAPLAKWEFDVIDSLPVTNKFYTDTTGQVVVCDLSPGTYTVAEDPFSSVISITSNVSLTPLSTTSVSFTWAVGQPSPGIVFRNGVPGPQ